MMNRRHWCFGLWGRLAAVAVLLSAGVAAGVQAQGLTVTAISVDDQSVQGVARVRVRLAGATNGQEQTLEKDQAIAPGAELTLPRSARVELTSSNGNKITLHPGARFLAGVITAKGETHQPLGGRIDFQVRKALDFFNIQYDRVTASVKGTDYSVEIDPAKSFTLSVTEGVVEIERQVQIKIAAAASDAATAKTTRNQGSGIRVAEDLKAGQSKTYRLDVEEYLEEFKNFGEAEAYFKKALSEAVASSDKRRVLRAVQNLMALYWMIGVPRAALKLESHCIALASETFDVNGEAECLNLAGLAGGLLGEYRKAIDNYEKSLAIRERAFAGRDHQEIALSLRNLAATHDKAGNVVEAARYRERAAAMTQRLKGTNK